MSILSKVLKIARIKKAMKSIICNNCLSGYIYKNLNRQTDNRNVFISDTTGKLKGERVIDTSFHTLAINEAVKVYEKIKDKL